MTNHARVESSFNGLSGKGHFDDVEIVRWVLSITANFSFLEYVVNWK